MMFVPLTNAKGVMTDWTVIDEADWEKVRDHRWSRHSKGYAQTHTRGRTVLMHRLLLDPGDGLWTDHINRRKLDNRRENLRAVTPSQNNLNRGAVEGSASREVGVFFWGQHKRWCAETRIAGRAVRRLFKTEAEAIAKARELRQRAWEAASA